MIASTHCRKCGEVIKVNFAELTYEQAVEKLREIRDYPRECPGWHVELGGWWWYWNFNELLAQAYPGRQPVEEWIRKEKAVCS